MTDSTYAIIRAYVINIFVVGILYYNTLDWAIWAIIWLLAFIAAYVSQWGTSKEKPQ